MRSTELDNASYLSSHGFHRNDQSGVWAQTAQPEFDYTDGDEVENRIANAIRCASDLSLFSTELGRQQTDWASIYHLSPSRANLLRPLADLLKGKDILEIGAGCGAISRYLGELEAHVLALEGSQRRAQIAASRCRDLSNVTVANQSLESFPQDRRFDVVTLIGVLEYARKYSSEDDGIAATLRKARALLKDDGILLVAIENQLGLKYFAGMHEDHLGRAMAGVQDHYDATSVVTFGKTELQHRILAAGFSDCEFALPFPDYKLPQNVIHPAGWMMSADFDAATLAGQATRADRQLTHPLLFSTIQAFSVARRNGLLADLSNSFLVLARASETSPMFSDAAPNVLASHYSADRLPEYMTSTFFQRKEGRVTVERKRLLAASPPRSSALVSQRVEDESYVLGRHWVDELDLILSRPGWSAHDVAQWLAVWQQALLKHAPELSADNKLTLRTHVPGAHVDAIPRNLIISADGQTIFFDQEWLFSSPINFGYLVFRAINVSLASITCVATPAEISLLHVPTLVRACLRHLGYVVTASDILDYLDFDAAFRNEVRGSMAKPLTLEEYEAYTLQLAPDITALLHGSNKDFPNEIIQRLSSQESELGTLSHQVNDLSSAITNAKMHVAVLESRVGEEEVAKLQARQELETREQELTFANSRLSEQVARVAELSASLSAAAATNSLLHQQLMDEREKTKTASAELVSDLNGRIALLESTLNDKDNEIHRLWAMLETHKFDSITGGELIQRLQQDLADALESLNVHNGLRQELEATRSSLSWRITAPLRTTKGFLLALIRRIASSAGAWGRRAYRSVPVPMYRKIALKNALFSRLPVLFSRTAAYRRWQADVRTHAADLGEYAPATDSGSLVSQASSDIPALYVADGVAEWKDYQEVRSRIAQASVLANQQKSPQSPRVLDFTSSDLRKVAAGISLPDTPVDPDVSIIVPAFNHAARSLECLASIAECWDKYGPTFEIIVADDASTEPDANIISEVSNVRFLRQDENVGFLRNCNSAAKQARGKALLFLNNDVQVTKGWLTALWNRLISDVEIGAVGPKIIYPSGWLQDAGTRLRRDGTAEMIGLNEHPAAGAYSYDRDVDYCSGACLLLRTADFVSLGGFDERFAPAYCEDSDLCLQLKKLGKRIVYCANAEVIHHLSATSDSLPSDYKLSCIATNLDKFSSKWRDELDDMDAVRTIAFYLPQFHPIPENDLWWGEGFTEWTNVTKALPNYAGHYQPRVPAELGYYDLRVPEVMNKQAELARRYGIGGFCFYYYWFAGHRLLEKPIERMLASGEPDFPFCLCWANENWTRRWDGQEQDVLMAQKHSDDDDLAVITDLARYFRSSNYIRVNGKPLILVYRVTLFPDFARTASLWRDYCKSVGIGEIYIAQVESFELVNAGIQPSDLGCDAAVEFPPQGMAEPHPPSGRILNDNFVGAVADYHDLAVRYATREMPPYKRFMGVMPGWDNTARRQNNSYSFERSTPGAFQAWLEAAVRRTKQQHCGDERLIFINAWNEWAEGAYLEPDRRFGHSFLQAHLNALEAEYLMTQKSIFPG